MGSSAMLPSGWKQVCGKPQHSEEEHTAKCINWICPQGQRYKTWPDVQAYFQLLSFEEDIPGVECRPENARRTEVEPEVTLEEEAAREGVRKAALEKTGAEEVKKRGRKKSEDEDYKPDEKTLKKVEVISAPKRSRRSLPAAATIKKVEVVEKFPCSQCKVELGSKSDLEIHVKNFHKTTNTTLDEITELVVPKKNLRGSNNSVTISEVKPAPEVISLPKEEPTNANTQKLFSERFEVFKAFCLAAQPKVDPVMAEPKTIDLFLENLAKKKSVNKSVQAGYRQAVLKVQEELRAQRRRSAPLPQTSGVAKSAPAPQMKAAPAKPATPSTIGRPAAPTPRQPAPSPRMATSTPVRPTAPVQRMQTPKPADPSPRQSTPQRAPTPRQAAPIPRGATPRQTAPRPMTPQAVGRPAAPRQTTPQGGRAQYSGLPSFLATQVSFPARLEINSGGGESLYRSAAQHAGLGQEGCRELRRYCHTMLLKWWQWYEPYYAFPMQVKIGVKTATVQRNMPTAAAFKEFLKGEESLNSFNNSECEVYCLANIIGVPIHQLTYNLVGVPGKPEQRCKWETLEPHQGLVHQNKFVRNKEPLYILYEDKVVFTRIVKT